MAREKAYTPEDVIAYLKSRASGGKCIECGAFDWTAEPDGQHGYGFFTVTCNKCGHEGLFNAMELIGRQS